MHLGNGAVTPECGFVALGVAAVGAGVAVVAARALGVDRARARTAGALGAAVFAAQLFNVPLLPFSSVHLIGGVLLAWVLGPGLGALTMTGILALQAVLLGDGGLLAMGANIINMGLLPAAAVALVRRGTMEISSARAAWTLGLTAFACTVGAAALIVLEVSVGRGAEQLAGLGAFASRMVWWHALAGLLEGGLSVAIVAVLGKLGERSAGGSRKSGSQIGGLQLSPRGAGLVIAASLVIAVCSLRAFGMASTSPDGYESALALARQAGLAVGSIDTTGRLAGASALAQGWQETLESASALEPALVVLATILAGALAWGFARMTAGARSQMPRNGLVA